MMNILRSLTEYTVLGLLIVVLSGGIQTSVRGQAFGSFSNQGSSVFGKGQFEPFSRGGGLFSSGPGRSFGIIDQILNPLRGFWSAPAPGGPDFSVQTAKTSVTDELRSDPDTVPVSAASSMEPMSADGSDSDPENVRSVEEIGKMINSPKGRRKLSNMSRDKQRELVRKVEGHPKYGKLVDQIRDNSRDNVMKVLTAPRGEEVSFFFGAVTKEGKGWDKDVARELVDVVKSTR